jgi:hypothetical protein
MTPRTRARLWRAGAARDDVRVKRIVGQVGVRLKF